MALWPPELFNTDKSSLSVRTRQGDAFKVSNWHYTKKIKNSRDLKMAKD